LTTSLGREVQVEIENEKKVWELEAWFKLLAEKAQKLKVGAVERLYIEMTLRYLRMEANTRRDRRDNQQIKRVLLLVHPYLKNHRQLDQFKNNLKMKNSLQFFVKNGFL
jgi:hypothetical protein